MDGNDDNDCNIMMIMMVIVVLTVKEMSRVKLEILAKNCLYVSTT